MPGISAGTRRGGTEASCVGPAPPRQFSAQMPLPQPTRQAHPPGRRGSVAIPRGSVAQLLQPQLAATAAAAAHPPGRRGSVAIPRVSVAQLLQQQLAATAAAAAAAAAYSSKLTAALAAEEEAAASDSPFARAGATATLEAARAARAEHARLLQLQGPCPFSSSSCSSRSRGSNSRSRSRVLTVSLRKASPSATSSARAAMRRPSSSWSRHAEDSRAQQAPLICAGETHSLEEFVRSDVAQHGNSLSRSCQICPRLFDAGQRIQCDGCLRLGCLVCMYVRWPSRWFCVDCCVSAGT